jgi:hypothetical protein
MLQNVQLYRGNSVDFLRSLSSTLSQALNFVYLDAHWNDYLPLRDELLILEKVAEHCRHDRRLQGSL